MHALLRCKMMHRKPKQNKRDDNGADGDVFIGQDIYTRCIIIANGKFYLASNKLDDLANIYIIRN